MIARRTLDGHLFPGVGHPFWGTHKKTNEKAEQELREFVRLKHHSHGLKNQHVG